MAITAAAAADCPRIINTGSIRVLNRRQCDLQTQTGTNKLVHSSFLVQ